MITDPIALLRDAENYLSALHGSVARHDNLAANLACAGCELRDRIAAALPELAAVSSAVVAPPTGQTALRDRIAEALISWTYRGKEPDPNVGILETVRANAYSRADAVLAVLCREWPWLRAEAEDAAPTDHTTPPAWVDGHPQLEAIAAAVWEQCGRSDNGACVDDDPRNIAVAALSAVRNTADDQAAENKRCGADLLAVQPAAREDGGAR